jgi:hypothetical protein
MEKLSTQKLVNVSAGGPIADVFALHFDTIGSFYHGLFNGLVGNKPCL